jgi:hypothetical protein
MHLLISCQLNKALVQIHMPDSETQKAGCQLLRTTVDSMAPVLDSDVLEAVEEAANTAYQIKSLRDVASSMWEATLKARPNNEELLLTVVEQKVAAGDWDAARKVCYSSSHRFSYIERCIVLYDKDEERP